MDTTAEFELLANTVALASTDAASRSASSIPEMLRAIRKHLGMDVAFVSEFVGGQRKFKYVDSEGETCPIKVDDAGPLDESYCQRIVDGRLAALIHDALLDPVALELAVTRTLPVRSHLSVPIYLGDGELYGTLCCFNSSHADHTLDIRDLGMLKAFAALTGKQIEQGIAAERVNTKKRARIRAVIENKALSIHYQPIVHLGMNKIVGFESLSRFSAEPRRTPDVWFREAGEVGLGQQLELLAIEEALLALDHLPDDIYIALNVSPNTIISGQLGNVLKNVARLHRIVLEVTEHARVTDYWALGYALAPLRRQGMRLAIDDAGAGYASFLHILMLTPDIIKLDMSLIRDIDSNSNRRALAAAIIGFAQQTGSVIIAEGVETKAELETLKALDVVKAQGYLLGRPGDLSAALELLNMKHHVGSLASVSKHVDAERVLRD